MAARVYEKTAMRLIRISHRLEDLKPTAQELDVERFRTDVGMLESGIDSMIDRREGTMKRMGKLDKDQKLCRRCGVGTLPVDDDKEECGPCSHKNAVSRLGGILE